VVTPLAAAIGGSGAAAASVYIEFCVEGTGVWHIVRGVGWVFCTVQLHRVAGWWHVARRTLLADYHQQLWRLTKRALGCPGLSAVVGFLLAGGKSNLFESV
jgi:hypothetical protein